MEVQGHFLPFAANIRKRILERNTIEENNREKERIRLDSDLEQKIIYALPEEIFLNIFEFLPQKDLYHVSLVDRRFSQIANSPEMIQAFFKGRFIDFHSTWTERFHIDRVQLINLAMKCGASLSDFAIYCPIKNNPLNFRSHLENFVSKCSNIKSINLSIFPEICDKDIIYLQRLPKLNKFVLGPDTIQQLHGYTQPARFNVTDEGLKDLPLQLEEVDLCCYDEEGRNVITDETLKHLGKMQSLRRLSFSNCHSISIKGLEYLANLPKLVELDLSETNFDNNKVLMSVCKMLPNLRVLMTHIDHVDENLMQEIKNCNEKLDVSFDGYLEFRGYPG